MLGSLVSSFCHSLAWTCTNLGLHQISQLRELILQISSSSRNLPMFFLSYFLPTVVALPFIIGLMCASGVL